MFQGKTILVTGGTGSFGHAFIHLVLKEHAPNRVIVYSRDEKKQHDMRLALSDDRVKFVIGDVRDRDQVFSAMRGVDYVFHAAALKQVPSCEFFPMEAVRTNILGANNVLDAADYHDVQKLVVLSTDKAVYPINAMGQSKALMEKLVMSRARDQHTRTVCCAVRYGNVMYSRGSVIPLFVEQIKSGKPLTITDGQMTRFLLPLRQAVDLVQFAMQHGNPGDLFVRKASAATIDTLARAMLNLFGTSNEVSKIGVREGEKMHEVLVTSEELVRAEEFDDYFRIRNSLDRDYNAYFSKGSDAAKYAKDGFTSHNTKRLDVQETEQLLLCLPEFREELDSWASSWAKAKKAA